MLEVGSMRMRRGEARPRIGEILRMRSNERVSASTGTPADLKVPSLANVDGQFLAFGLNGPSRVVGGVLLVILLKEVEKSRPREGTFLAYIR
jgi:hypothetical protein